MLKHSVVRLLWCGFLVSMLAIVLLARVVGGLLLVVFATFVFVYHSVLILDLRVGCPDFCFACSECYLVGVFSTFALMGLFYLVFGF